MGDAYCSHAHPKEMNTNFGIMELGGASLQIMSNAHTKHCFSFLGQDASMRLLANKYEKCPEDNLTYTAKDNASEHLIFTEDYEETLKDLVEEHIFTDENIAVIRRNLGTQENYFLASALYNFQGEFKDFNRETGTAPCPRGCEGNIVSRGCEGNIGCKGTGIVDLIGFIAGNDRCPALAKNVRPKFQRTDRYVFYFLKKLFTEFSDNIKIAKGADLSWPRGLAIMQPYDISQNTEMNREELRKLLDGIRKGGINVPLRKFCTGCKRWEYTNAAACRACAGDDATLKSSEEMTGTDYSAETSERSVSPMSAHRRLLQE